MVEPVVVVGGTAIGHGWFVAPAVEPVWFSHDGGNLGFESRVQGTVDGRHGIAVLTNANGARALIDDVVTVVGRIEGWPP